MLSNSTQRKKALALRVAPRSNFFGKTPLFFRFNAVNAAMFGLNAVNAAIFPIQRR